MPTGAVAQILAISGSLRRDSINAAALRAMSSAAPGDRIAVDIDDWPRILPHFDPDLEAFPPETVCRFRLACAKANGVLLAVPEYAFGIPGAFKNALDWTVGSGSLYRKPVTVLSVAPEGRGKDVQHALGRVLEALDADVAYRKVPILQADRGDTGEVNSPKILAELRAVLAELVVRGHVPGLSAP